MGKRIEPMIITPDMVSAAEHHGFMMTGTFLYEERKPTQIFVHPNTGARKVFARWLLGRRVFLDHHDFPGLLAAWRAG